MYLIHLKPRRVKRLARVEKSLSELSKEGEETRRERIARDAAEGEALRARREAESRRREGTLSTRVSEKRWQSA
jgi:hypothetical protein